MGLLEPSSTTWRAALGRVPHDVFHEPGFAQVEAERLDGTALAAHARRGSAELILPLVVRAIPGSDARDATSPYGYPGPLFAGAADPELRRALVLDVLEELGGAGIVSLFVRLHPILDEDVVAPEGVAVVDHGETVAIDVREARDVLWGQTRAGHRTEIRRAERAGFRASFDETFRHVDAFGALYRETMDRVGAHGTYRFDDRYIEALRSALGDGLRLAVVERDGDIAAAALVTVSGGIVGYHLSGASQRDARWAPTKLLLDHVRGWAHDSGASWLHLGGGVGAGHDSLFAFKAGFGPGRRAFRTWRVVIDEPAYRALGADPTRLDGWFPGYRAPIAPADADDPVRSA